MEIYVYIPTYTHEKTYIYIYIHTYMYTGMQRQIKKERSKVGKQENLALPATPGTCSGPSAGSAACQLSRLPGATAQATVILRDNTD